MNSTKEILHQKREALRIALMRNVDFLCDGGDADDGSATSCVQLETNELAKIEVALSKLEDGTYGLCEDCGKKISKARLEALPYVTRCLPCQQMAEGENVDENESQWERLAEREVGAILDEHLN